jgi:RimJ/RimL family protein N-acetyltransferase
MPFAHGPALLTERLRVRALQEADLAGLMEVNGDPVVTRFLPYAPWTSIADAQAWAQRMAGLEAAGTTLQFVIADRSDDRPLGSCVLLRYDEGSQRAELGYVLGRAHWGRGLMHEALQALLRQAFLGPLNLRRLEAEVHPDNAGSLRTAQRLGFVVEGRYRQRWVRQGQPHDTVLHGLLRDEWLAANPG